MEATYLSSCQRPFGSHLPGHHYSAYSRVNLLQNPPTAPPLPPIHTSSTPSFFPSYAFILIMNKHIPCVNPNTVFIRYEQDTCQSISISSLGMVPASRSPAFLAGDDQPVPYSSLGSYAPANPNLASRYEIPPILASLPNHHTSCTLTSLERADRMARYGIQSAGALPKKSGGRNTLPTPWHYP